MSGAVLLRTFGPVGGAFVVGGVLGGVTGYFLVDTVASTVDQLAESVKKNTWAPALVCAVAGGAAGVMLYSGTGRSLASLIPL